MYYPAELEMEYNFANTDDTKQTWTRSTIRCFLLFCFFVFFCKLQIWSVRLHLNRKKDVFVHIDVNTLRFRELKPE